MLQKLSLRERLALALGLAVLAGLLLYVVGVWRNQSYDYWYLGYNLLLGFIPLLCSLWFVRAAHYQPRRSWLLWVIALLWLLFLPNSFYIVTDFIHLPETQRVDIVQDVLMIMQFSLLGLIFGYASLYIMHHECKQYISRRWADLLVGVILLLSSFAIYLGRELRWNSWDILLNPLTLGTDITLHLVYPFAYPNMLSITLSFFLFLASIYVIICSMMMLVKKGVIGRILTK